MTVRVAFIITAILGAIYAAAGLFAPTATDFVVGTLVAMVGWIGVGAAEWVRDR